MALYTPFVQEWGGISSIRLKGLLKAKEDKEDEQTKQNLTPDGFWAFFAGPVFLAGALFLAGVVWNKAIIN